MKIFNIILACSWVLFVFLVACKHKKEDAPNPTKNPLLPYPGVYQYRYTSEIIGNSQPGDQIEIIFQLTVNDKGKHHVDIVQFRKSELGGPLKYYDVAQSCRDSFHTDSGLVGSFTLEDVQNIADIIPPCLDESWMQGLTDIVYVLRAQGTQRYNVQALGQDNRNATFNAFADSWTKPPYLLHARLGAPGGSILWTESGAYSYLWVEPSELVIEKLYKETTGNALYAINTEMKLKIEITDSGILKSAESVRGTDHLYKWNLGSKAQIPPRNEYIKVAADSFIEKYRATTLRRIGY